MTAREGGTVSDFRIHRHAATGDASLFPVSDKARQYVRQYRDEYGQDALVGMSIFCETSRSADYLTDTVADLAALGFTIR